MRMATRITALIKPDTDSRADSDVDPESTARLASLGYVGHVAVTHPTQRERSAVDPKDCIAYYNAFVRSQRAESTTWPMVAFAGSAHPCLAR